MSAASIQVIGILGSGQMGGGIAQTAAQSGFQVWIADQRIELALASRDRIAKQLQKSIEKGKLSEQDRDAALSRIKAVASLSDLALADLVVEAATENPKLKFELFSALDRTCKPATLLATNTSSISITQIAASTQRPQQVAGLHFMNPVPVMKLVEGIRGLQTSDATFLTFRQVAEKMGKTFIEAKDFPGFAVNRILMPMINEAVYALYEGIASRDDIDAAMKLGTNQPMGPLTLADFIGLDTCLATMEVLHQGLGDTKYRPCPLLKNHVAAGWLGKKTGRGFYTYDS